MSNKKEDATYLLKSGMRLQKVADSTGMSLNAVKKLSQMLNLYDKVEDVELVNYLVNLKHDALLFNKVKDKDKLINTIKFVIATTNGNKVPRAELKNIIDNYLSDKNIDVDASKYLELINRIEILEKNFSKEALDRIGLVDDLSIDHPSYFILKYKPVRESKNELLNAGIIKYDETTYCYYILKVSLLLNNLDKVYFEERYKKPLDLDKDIVISYIENLARS